MSAKRYRIVKSSDAALDEVAGEWSVQFRIQKRDLLGRWNWVRREVASTFVSDTTGSMYVERTNPVAVFQTEEEARTYCLNMFSVDLHDAVNWEVVSEFKI